MELFKSLLIVSGIWAAIMSVGMGIPFTTAFVATFTVFGILALLGHALGYGEGDSEGPHPPEDGNPPFGPG